MAWALGFGDGSDFGGKLVGKRGKQAWLGPADFAEALSGQGIPARLIHFNAQRTEALQAAAREEALAAILVHTRQTSGRQNWLPVLVQPGEGAAAIVIMGKRVRNARYHLLVCDGSAKAGEDTLRWVPAHSVLANVKDNVQILVTGTGPLDREVCAFAAGFPAATIC